MELSQVMTQYVAPAISLFAVVAFIVAWARAAKKARAWKKAADLWRHDANEANSARRRLSIQAYNLLARAPEFDEDDREVIEAVLDAFAQHVDLSDFSVAGAVDITPRWAGEPLVLVEWPDKVVTLRAFVEHIDPEEDDEEDDEEWEDEDDLDADEDEVGEEVEAGKAILA